MGSEANDVERLFDALDELRLFLANSFPAAPQTKPKCSSPGRLGTRLLGDSLHILSESFLARWKRYRYQYQRKRNAFRLLTLSGVVRPANVELSCGGGRERQEFDHEKLYPRKT
jgi:hypothetical protein